MKIYSFEKLECWQVAKELSILIYKITSKFPSEEKYGLMSQMRRAAVSVCSNIAEGSSRITEKDKSHFTVMAYSSAVELLNQLIISNELKFISPTEYEEAREKIESTTKLIAGLRKFQQQKIAVPKP